MTDAPYARNPELLLSHADFVRALARSLIHDEHLADDVVQEAWLAALQKSEPSRKSPRAWFAGTVRNLSLKRLRTESRAARKARAAPSTEPVRSPEEMVERETARRKVVDAVNALEEPYRSTILFRYYDDMPPRQIARHLDVPVETVKTRIQRGLERMRRRLDASYEGGRKAWCLALAPVVGIKTATISTGTAAASVLFGALAMSVKTKILVAATLIVLLGLAYTILLPDGEKKNNQSAPLGQVDQDRREQTVPGEEPPAAKADRVPLMPENTAADDAMPESFARALGGIKGRLVESDGTPVPHTSIGIVGADLFDLLRHLGDLNRDGPSDFTLKEASTRTAEDGTFFFSGVYPRSFYALWADAGGPRSFARGVDILPAPGETADLGDVVLPPYVVFCGKVVDEAGEPVRGARIRATNLPPIVLMTGWQDFVRGGSFLVDAGRGYSGLVVEPPPAFYDLFDKLPLPTTRTGADGTFRLEGVPLGLALVVVDHNDFATLPCGPFGTGRGGEKNIGDLVLLEGHRVRGVVTDHEGAPLRGIEVRAGSVHTFKEFTVLKPPVVTDAEGEFRVDTLATESAMVAVQRFAKDKWTVVGPLFTDDEPVTIALPPAYDLKITVMTEDGDPVEGARLKIRSNEYPTDFSLFDPPMVPEERMERPAPGTILVSDLPAGKYECLITAPGYAAVRKKVTVNEEPLEKQVIVEPSLTARVRVVDANSAAPVEWAEVHASVGSSDWTRGSHRFSHCRTDGDGRGELEHLRPGKYTIAVTHPGYALSFGVLEMPADDEVILNVEEGGSIEGVVYSMSDEWMGPSMIVFDRLKWRHAPGGEAPCITATDSDGRFRVIHLTPGEWLVHVLPRLFDKSPAELMGALDADQYNHGTVIVKSAETTHIEITPGQNAPEETGSVSGRIAVDQVPATGMDVIVYSRKGLQTKTASDGGYHFAEVPAGKLYMAVSHKARREGSPEFSIVRMIHIEANRTTYEDFDIRTGSLSGRITEPGGGAPVPGAVGLSIDAERGDSKARVTSFFQTAEDGTFHLEGVPTGTYRLQSEDSRRPCTPVDKLMISAGSHIGPVDLELIVYDRVAGRVILSEELMDAHRLMLSCYVPDDESRGGCMLEVSPETGAFESTIMPPGHYVITLNVDMDGHGRYEYNFQNMVLDVPEGGITGVILEPVEK